MKCDILVNHSCHIYSVKYRHISSWVLRSYALFSFPRNLSHTSISTLKSLSTSVFVGELVKRKLVLGDPCGKLYVGGWKVDFSWLTDIHFDTILHFCWTVDKSKYHKCEEIVVCSRKWGGLKQPRHTWVSPWHFSILLSPGYIYKQSLQITSDLRDISWHCQNWPKFVQGFFQVKAEPIKSERVQ